MDILQQRGKKEYTKTTIQEEKVTFEEEEKS